MASLLTRRAVAFLISATIAVLLVFIPTGYPQELRSRHYVSGMNVGAWQVQPGQPFRIEAAIVDDPSQWYPWSAKAYVEKVYSYLYGLVTGRLTETVAVTPFSMQEVAVLPLVLKGWLKSFLLFFGAVGAGTVLGIGAGVAIFTFPRLQRVVGIAVSLGGAVPDFMLVQAGWILAILTWSRFGWRPWSVAATADQARWWLLPLLVMSVAPLAYFFRLTLLGLTRVAPLDYIRTAHAKGLSSAKVLVKHALVSSLPSILNGVPVALNISLSSLLVVEMLTAYPGIAKLILNASPAFAATGILMFCLWYWVMDGVSQVLRVWSDPRLRGERHG